MSDTISLKATAREAGRGLQTLRRGGSMPAVLYGHGVKPQGITIDSREFARAYKAAGENTILSLSIGDGKVMNVLIKETQLHPMTNRFTHADFFQVRMDEAIEANIPLEFVGEAPAVRESGGILVKALDEVEVSALPADLPHLISVDLSKLATFDDVINVGDLAIPAKVTVKADPETVVALVEAARSQEELDKLNETVESDVTKVEKVEEKKKEDSTGEVAA